MQGATLTSEGVSSWLPMTVPLQEEAGRPPQQQPQPQAGLDGDDDVPTRFWIQRASGDAGWADKGGWLVPSYKADLQMWHWQLSTAPRWSSSNRPEASAALQQFLEAHGSKLHAEAHETIEAHITNLQHQRHNRVPPIHQEAATSEATSSQDSQTAREDSLTHAEVLEIMHAPIGTCRHIPSDSLAAIMKLFKAQLLNDADSEIVFILPKLLWPVLPESENPKARAKRISGNVGQAVAGHWRALATQCMQLTKWTAADGGTDARQSPQASAEKLVEAIKKGRPMTKTWHQLRNGAPLCTQPEQWAEAKRLLKPYGDDPIHADLRAGAPDGPTITSAPIIPRLKVQRAADLGGWTHEALQQLMRPKHMTMSLDMWLNRIVTHLELNHPLRELLWHQKATLLGKRPSGVRPLLIGTIFQKVAAKAICALLRPMIPDRLLRTQYALGVPNGIANMTYLLQQELAIDGQAVLQVDISNAFCCMRRQPAVDLLLAKMQYTSLDQQRGWSSWLRRHLAEGLRIVWHDRSVKAAHTLVTHDGIGQGDPLSAMIFGAVIAAALDSLPSDLTEGWNHRGKRLNSWMTAALWRHHTNCAMASPRW